MKLNGIKLIFDGGFPMPSKSLKQKKFMSAASHSPKFAKKAGIPVKVAKEFHNADKGKYGHKKKGKMPV
jgi:hypothetical protein